MSQSGSNRHGLRLIQGGANRERHPRRPGRDRPGLRFLPSGLPDFPDDLLDSVHEVEHQIESLLSGDAGPVADCFRQKLTAASGSISSVESLVSLLKWKGRLAESDIDSNLFDLRFALHDVVEQHIASARARRVRIDCVVPPGEAVISGDRALMIDLLGFTLVEMLRGVTPGSIVKATLDERDGEYRLRMAVVGKRSAGWRFRQTGKQLAELALEPSGGSIAIPSDGSCVELRIPADSGQLTNNRVKSPI